MQSGISKQSGKLRQLARQKWFACAVLAFVTTAAPAYAFDTTAGVDNQSDFEQKYEKITVQLLLLGLDFEQYSLKYRMDALHDSRLKRTRYFLGQEAAAAGSLTAAIIGTDRIAERLGLYKRRPSMPNYGRSNFRRLRCR